VWMNRMLAWPLVLVGLAVVGLQFGIASAVWQTFGRIPPLLGAPAFMVGASCFEVVVDVLLVAWVARAITRRHDHARVAGLFFLWQGVKVSFAFLCVAVVYGGLPL